MKQRILSVTGAMVVCLAAMPNYGADEAGERGERSRLLPQLERLGHGAKATDILGMEVRDSENTKIGKVDELAVDLESGRIIHVIVSSGGVLGVGDKLVAVPARAFRLDPMNKALRSDFTPETWKAAPAFEMSKWDESFQSNRIVEVYRYYKHEPYFASRGLSSERPMDRRAPGRVEKASKVIGQNVHNLRDEKLGDVDNLVVDVEAGRIMHVILSSGGFLGLGDVLSAVPPTALRYDNARKVLQLDTTKEALAGAPHFKKSEWPRLDDSDYAQQVYRAHRVEPYFRAEADNTARNVRDRQPGSLTPFDQGTSESDVDMTRRIRKEVIALDDLSLNARNVKVITLNGRVTLRGPVNTEEEKRRISDIANRLAKPENVDNQLEVKRGDYPK